MIGLNKGLVVAILLRMQRSLGIIEMVVTMGRIGVRHLWCVWSRRGPVVARNALDARMARVQGTIVERLKLAAIVVILRLLHRMSIVIHGFIPRGGISLLYQVIVIRVVTGGG